MESIRNLDNLYTFAVLGISCFLAIISTYSIPCNACGLTYNCIAPQLIAVIRLTHLHNISRAAKIYSPWFSMNLLRNDYQFFCIIINHIFNCFSAMHPRKIQKHQIIRTTYSFL